MPSTPPPCAGHPAPCTPQFVTQRTIGDIQGAPFEATLIAAKQHLRVGERQTLLSAILDASVHLEYSCEGGICGTCIVEIAQGEINHRDSCLNDDERSEGFMAACVSRGKGPITILL
ncbi:MAG: 2Fe-2S iron-sulfur cluster-binding protein [Gemmatimonadaceae bacterium]